MKMQEESLILEQLRADVERLIGASIEGIGPNSAVRRACAYALQNGGKRFRPIISLLICKSLGNNGIGEFPALAVEYFHTASLIADDLPCMDNDDERRGSPSLHRACGEAVALLASYALIAAGYDALRQGGVALAASSLPHSNRADAIALEAIGCASKNTGLYGATGGQLEDLDSFGQSVDAMRQMIHHKTGALFEIAFVTGWLFGGGDPARVDEVKSVAFHYGQAFQLMDDIGDVEQDLAAGKAGNFALLLGKEAATDLAAEHLSAYKKALEDLGLASRELLALATFLKAESTLPQPAREPPVFPR